MARLLVHVEGQTEETFVGEVLRPHLLGVGFTVVSARLLGNARSRDRRGGARPWEAVRQDVLRHLKDDIGAISTTMVDYYGMPLTWPGRSEAATAPLAQRAAIVERRVLEDVAGRLGSEFRQDRFLPFVLMHEFEGLLFSDCRAFARGVCRDDLAPALHSIRKGFATPEDINDSPQTAPSKRVLSVLPGYQKPLHGVLAALEVGLGAMRDQCPHFAQWLSALEARAPGT